MRRKLRIAVLIDAWFPFYGGGQVHVREISKRLVGQCEFRFYHSSSPRALSRLIWALTVIPQIIHDHDKKPFDFVHAHAFIAGFPGTILSRVLRIPVIYTVHGSHTMDLHKHKRKVDGGVSLIKYFIEKWLLTRVRYTRQISVAKSFLAYPNLNRNIVVIPNGVDLKLFDWVEEKKRKQFTLIYVGRDDPIKGIRYLQKALDIVRRTHPDIDLIRVSGGKARGKKLVELYKTAHIFVLPSLAEGQPITLLEAWAARLPVIVTAVGDNPRMVKNGVNGYLVPPADASTLAKAILTAYKNPKLARLGKAGYNLVKSRYTWRKAVRATYQVYKEVIHAAR